MLSFLVLLVTGLFPIYGVGAAGDVEVNADDKVLVWAYNNPFGEANSPTDSTSVYSQDYMASIYNGLLKRTIASDRAYVNDLAATYPTVSANSTVWTFTLRSGLTFSDGSALNASSVVFSYKVSLTASIDSGAGDLALYFPTNSSIWEVDNLTVRFNMSQPYAFAPGLFSRNIYSEDHFGPQYASCEANIAACDWNTDLTGGNLKGGAGPLMMDKYDTTNNFIELVPNPNYYNFGQIKLDRIVIRTIIDATAAKAAFAAGETNIFDSQYRAKAVDFTNLAGITDVFIDEGRTQEMVPNHNHQYFGIGTIY